MDSSEQGVDVVIIVFIGACGFFFNVLVNRLRYFLSHVFNSSLHLGLVLSEQVIFTIVGEQIVITVIGKQVVAIIVVIGEHVITIVFCDLGFIFHCTGGKQVVVLTVVVQ